LKKQADGSTTAEGFDRTDTHAVKEKLLNYFKVKDFNELRKLFLHQPKEFLARLKKMPSENKMEYGLLLQTLASFLSPRFEKVLRILAERRNLDYYELLRGKLNIKNPCYEIYKIVMKYDVKNEEFYNPKHLDFFVIPPLYVKKLGKLYFVVNPETGRWIIVDNLDPLTEQHYSTVFSPQDVVVGDTMYIRKDLIDKKTRDYLSKLEKAGVINRRQQYSFEVKPVELDIVVNTSCNMACKYCYEKNIQQVPMNLKAVNTTVTKLMNKFPSIRRVLFFGGEPLLSMYEIMDLVYHPLIQIKEKHIQTNLTLLNEEIAKFLKFHKFKIGVSLDGKKKHNRLRVFKNGNPSYEKVMKNIELLKKHGLGFGLLSVLHKYNVKFYDAMKWVEEIGAGSIHFNIEWGKYKATPNQMFNFFKQTFEDYVNNDYNFRYSTLIWMIEGLLVDPSERSLMCSRNPCGAGTAHIAVNPDGTVSPCPELWFIKSDVEHMIYDFRDVYCLFKDQVCKDNPYRNMAVCCPGKNYYVNKDMRKPVKEMKEFHDLIYPWLANKLINDKNYLKVFKKWKSRPVQITRVK